MEHQLTDLIDGQYTVVEKHRGGMSLVYLVVDTFSQKRFAIKTVKEDYLGDRLIIDRFCEEARTWMNIGRHLHVVEAIIFREIQDQPYLWLEYVDGSDLQRLLDVEKRLFPVQIIRYALQVADAMAWVHVAPVRGRQGVIHRDLKPANIMLDRRLGIKITDFGLAKVYGQSRAITDAGKGLGTYLYMPPEQFLDATSADATSDVYSFGACMYALLTGHPPVSGDTVGNIVNYILSRTPPPPYSVEALVPQELSEIVMHCLAKKREDRYPSFQKLAQALQAVLPVVENAAATVETRSCNGCEYLTRHPYRLCPICASTFQVAAFEDLKTQPKVLPQPAIPEIILKSKTSTNEGSQQSALGIPHLPTVQELITQARQQRDEGRLPQAVAILRTVLAQEPENTEARDLHDQLALEAARTRPVAAIRSYNWSMLRGNITRTGYTPEAILPPLSRRWRTKLGEWVSSSPAVVNGVVYGGAFVDRPGKRGILAALRAKDGAIIWQNDMPYEIMSSPTVFEGKVLFIGCRNSLLSFDCATGRRLWEYTSGGSVQCSPVVWKSVVYFTSGDGHLTALNVQDGKQLWTLRTGGEIMSSPAWWNDVLYFGSADHRLYAVNAKNGQLIWEFVTAGEITATPAFLGNRIFIGSADRRVYCVDALSGSKLWEYQTEGEVIASPAVTDQVVIAGSRDHCIYALSTQSGELQWTVATGDWVQSSPLISGNTVYCGSHDNKLHAIEIRLGIELWEYSTDGEIHSSPAVSGGALFVGSNDGYIYCFVPR